MTKIDPTEYTFEETMKPSEVTTEIKTMVKDTKQVMTKYGSKRVLVLENGKQVFLNAFSLQNLVKGLGDETVDWIGKDVIITTETSERTQGKQSIIIKTE